MSGTNIPVDSTHLSDQASAEMIEEYGGAVDSQFHRKSIMRNFLKLKMLTGTDTAIKRRTGRTSLTTVTPGVRPAATKTPFGRTAVSVDTVILARDNRSLLNEFQTDFNARKDLGEDHGKELAKLFDESLLIAAVKAASKTLTTAEQLNGAFGSGGSSSSVRPMDSANDQFVSAELYEEISQGIVTMDTRDIDPEECVVFVNPTQHEVLLGNDKLIDKDFSTDNGDFANGTLKTILGVPIISTNRLPQSGAAVTGHALSTSANSNFFDTTLIEERTVALIMHPKSVFAAETIPLTSKVYYDDVELQWFIDSYQAYGAAVDRPDCSIVIHSVV